MSTRRLGWAEVLSDLLAESEHDNITIDEWVIEFANQRDISRSEAKRLMGTNQVRARRISRACAKVNGEGRFSTAAVQANGELSGRGRGRKTHAIHRCGPDDPLFVASIRRISESGIGSDDRAIRDVSQAVAAGRLTAAAARAALSPIVESHRERGIALRQLMSGKPAFKALGPGKGKAA